MKDGLAVFSIITGAVGLGMIYIPLSLIFLSGISGWVSYQLTSSEQVGE